MRVIALDLDGTLLDCKERQSLLAASLCRASGIVLNIELFWSAKREGATTTSAILEQGIDVAFATKLSKLWTTHVESEAWLQMDRLFPGVMRALQDARKLGIRLHLVTARTNECALRRQLHWLSIDPFFDHVEVVCPREAAQQKAKYLSVSMPDLYIGDSETDAIAAKAAQIRFLAVTSGQRSAAYLQSRTDINVKDLKFDFTEVMRGI